MDNNEQLKEKLAVEKKELIERKEKLGRFLRSQDFMDLDMKSKTLLRSQLKVMNQYINILGWRLELLGVKPGCQKAGIKEDEEIVDSGAPAD